MQTRKLYYEDCHIKEFTARVCACDAVDSGFLVVLDATAFYPEGGGQACDLGRLGDVRVLDVQERGDEIVHLCDGALEVGSTVTGVLDWERRFDLMQQHTGEHILSGLIHKAFGYHNTGFHVGAKVMEVDFDGVIPADALPELELQANRALWENVPVLCSVPSAEALPHIPYRTKRQLPWPVRLVQIPGYDSCACCGVHTATTGEVGILKIISCTKLRQGVRLELVCGGRAYAYLAAVFEQNKLVSQSFSAKPLETGAAAEKMNEALAAEKYRATGLQDQILQLLAERYVNQKNVLCFPQDLSGAQLRQLTEKIVPSCEGYVAVFSGSDGNYSYCLGGNGADIAQLGQAMNDALGGRGGGKGNFRQGTVPATRAQIEAFFKTV